MPRFAKSISTRPPCAAPAGLRLVAVWLLAGAPLITGTAPVFRMPLHKDSVPVYRHGVIKSYKTAYVGEVVVGSPPQRFSAIFDTGSAQVILPLAECEMDSCKSHRQYDAAKSLTSQHVNEDGGPARDTRFFPGADRDRTKVRFGTGEIEGAFVSDIMCLDADAVTVNASRADCAHLLLVGAFFMSDEPFKYFRFDGVIGMGLASLALTPQFSFFEVLSGGLPPNAEPHFGVYLSQEAKGSLSEISIGGHDPHRMLTPLHWSEVVEAETGHWQIGIRRVFVNGEPLEQCEMGDCLAIVDTGCTALGVPKEARPWIFERTALKIEGVHPDVVCKDVDAPEILFDLGSFSVVLDNRDYFKKRPLIVDGHMRAEINGVLQANNEVAGDSPTADEAPAPVPVPKSLTAKEADAHFEQRAAERYTICQPSLLPVPTAPPLKKGKVFIFGEPVLKRYYTAFDWEKLRVGFAVANHDVLPSPAPAPAPAPEKTGDFLRRDSVVQV